MKNAFYFISKAPFVLKIFKFLSRLFGNVGETAWLESRGGSRTAATFKMERFVIISSGWNLLTIITKHSILDVAAVLDPPLRKIKFMIQISWFKIQTSKFMTSQPERYAQF